MPEFDEEFRQFPNLREQFAAEWETPELDLDKYFSELTFLLAGYIAYSHLMQITLNLDESLLNEAF